MRKYRVKPATKSKPLLLPWVAGLILILAVGFVSTRIIQLLQTPSYVQKQQFFQHRVEQILDRVLGRSHYVVNVGVQLAEVKRETQRVQYTPRNVTERIEETLTVPENEPQPVEAKKADPQITEPPPKPKEKIERLPGLAPRAVVMAPGGVPGFPRVSALAGDAVQKARQSSAPVIQGRESHNTQIHVKQFFNENKETIVYPETTIDHLSVSLILDQSRLKELDITTEDVQAVIHSTIGFVPDRGDTVRIISYPFKGLGYWFSKVGLSLYALIMSYMHQITSLFLIVLVAGVLFVATRLALRERTNHLRRIEKAAAESRRESTARIDYQTQSQLDELVSMAQRRPKDFVASINRWLMSSEENP